MNRSFLTCLLAALIAAPVSSFALDNVTRNDGTTPPNATYALTANNDQQLAVIKPGKSKKHKKKMSKQMKKKKKR